MTPSKNGSTDTSAHLEVRALKKDFFLIIGWFLVQARMQAGG